MKNPRDLCEMSAALQFNSQVYLLAKEKVNFKTEKREVSLEIQFEKKMKRNFSTVKSVIKVIKNYIFDFRIFGVWVGTFGLFSNRWFFYG